MRCSKETAKGEGKGNKKKDKVSLQHAPQSSVHHLDGVTN